MDLKMEVYSPSLELLGVLEVQRSVIWESKAFSSGSFSVESLITDESRALLVPENIIWIEGETAGIIEYVRRQARMDGPYITVKGRDLTGILDRRILWGQYDLYGTVPDLMRHLVDDCCIHPTRGDTEARVVPGLVLDNTPPGPSPSLPDGYTQLEYIESSGTQHIDTGFHPTPETRVIADVEVISTSGTKGIFGSRDENSGTASKMFCFWVRTATQFRTDYFGTQQSANVENAFSRVIVDKNKNVTKIEDVTVTNSAVSEGGACEKSIFLFNINPGNYGSTARMYSLQIYDNGEISRNYVPCKNSAGDIGLYDLAGKSFYGNAGTGTFIAGPNAKQSKSTPVAEGQKVCKQQTGGTLLEALEELGEAYQVAFGVRFNPEFPRMEFWARYGMDRSTGQTVNEPVFYSTELDDVLESDYDYDSGNYRNVTLVAGEGEGADRVCVTVENPVESEPQPQPPGTTYTITLSIDPAGGGVVTGGGTVQSGASVTVTATPSSGYIFSGWRESGAIVSAETSYTFPATGDRNLTAVFAVDSTRYTITTSVDPTGAGTVSGAGTYEDGANVTLTASPADGYEFSAWRENGTNVSTSATYTFTASSNRTLTAVFAVIPSYTVTASVDPSGAGTVTGAGTYRRGTSVTVTATPADGYTFSGWKNGSTTVSTSASYTLTVTANVALTAAFAVASRLPAGYTEVEYVKSTATVYIATGITPNISTTKIESKWMLDSLTNNYNPFFGGGMYAGFYYVRANSATSFAYRFQSAAGGERTKTVTSMVGREITIDINYSSKTLIVDGSSVSMGTVNAPSSELYLFNMAKSSLSTYKFSGKCYYFKIYSGSSLVADFVPCKNSSGVAGMYDTVRKAFYTTPINTSGLTAGPAV